MIKRKFFSTFERYQNVKLHNNDQEVIDKLMKNKSLVFLRQDKGRGVVIMDKCKYIEKSSTFLEGPQFVKLSTDPTKPFQSKVQRTLLSMKKAFDKRTYKKLYPSASHPGLFFATGKVHKLDGKKQDVDLLPLRPVISNIGTATYEVSKYVSDLISPLAKGKYTIESTKDFINKLKCKSIKPGYQMVSFDVTNLFTNIPLNFTINIILDKIYKEKLIKTTLKRDELRKLLELCTKEMHFSFNDVIYKQVDGVAMGSPLGPVLANVFMVELENQLIPKMSEKVSLWERYVDDTFTFIKENEIENVKNVLNTFHKDIKFTHEVEKNGNIAFLDVSVNKKEDGSFQTKVYRKKTDTNLYVNWMSFAPKAWKIGTLKGLFRRAFLVCSEEEGLNEEIKHLKYVFTKINGYPSRTVNYTLESVKKTLQNEAQIRSQILGSNDVPQAENISKDIEVTDKFPIICLPYKGKKGEGILRELKGTLNKYLPKQVKPRIIYKGTKVGSFFRTKDVVKKEHLSELVYGYFDNYNSSNEEIIKYIGETNVRYEKRTDEHMTTDKNSSVCKYLKENKIQATKTNFKILEKGYSKSVDRKLAEALYIKELKPILNEQVKSFKLQLFN